MLSKPRYGITSGGKLIYDLFRLLHKCLFQLKAQRVSRIRLIVTYRDP